MIFIFMNLFYITSISNMIKINISNEIKYFGGNRKLKKQYAEPKTVLTKQMQYSKIL